MKHNLFIGVIAVLVGVTAGNSIKQANQIEALEQLVQKQHEVICMNSNSLPLQYSEHAVMCTGVVAEVLHRHGVRMQ